jgi:hypothetical protein
MKLWEDLDAFDKGSFKPAAITAATKNQLHKKAL